MQIFPGISRNFAKFKDFRPDESLGGRREGTMSTKSTKSTDSTDRDSTDSDSTDSTKSTNSAFSKTVKILIRETQTGLESRKV